MPAKKPKQYGRGAKGRRPSARRMGTLDLSSGQHSEDDITTETATAPEHKTYNNNAKPKNNVDCIGNDWSSPEPVGNCAVTPQEKPSASNGANIMKDLLSDSPRRGQDDTVGKDPFEEQGTLGFDWGPLLGEELEDMDIDQEFDAFEPTQHSNKSSSPNTLLDRSLRPGQSNNHSEQSQRTVGFLGDDFAASDLGVDDEQDSTSHASRSEKKVSGNKMNGENREGSNTQANSKQNQRGPLQDDVKDLDDVSSPEQPPKTRLSVANYSPTGAKNRKPQPKKAKQVAKKPFDPTQAASGPKVPPQSLRGKPAKKVAASRSKPAGQRAREADGKAQPSGRQGGAVDLYEIGAGFESLPKVLGAKKTRISPEQQAAVISNASEPKKAAPVPAKPRAKASTTSTHERRPPSAESRKHRPDDDEKYHPEKLKDMTAEVPNKRAKRHEMMEKSYHKKELRNVKHTPKKEPKLRSREEKVVSAGRAPQPDADEKFRDAAHDDEAIIIPSDTSDSSDDVYVPETQQREPPPLSKMNLMDTSTLCGDTDRVRRQGLGEVAEEHLDGTTLVDEHAARKPQVISFGRDGPKNLGRRSPRKHKGSPLHDEPRKKKVRTEAEGSLTFGNTAEISPRESAEVYPSSDEHLAMQMDASMTDGQHLLSVAGHNTTGLISGPEEPTRSIPEKPPTRNKVKEALFSAQQDTSMCPGSDFDEERQRQLPDEERLAQPTSQMAAPNPYRAPSRRSSRVDETGSPNAARTSLALNGAPSHPHQSEILHGPAMHDNTEKPPPEFRIEDFTGYRAEAIAFQPVPGYEIPGDTLKSNRLDRNALFSLKYKDNNATTAGHPVLKEQKHPLRPVETSHRPVSARFMNSFKEVLQMDEQSNQGDCGRQKILAQTPVSILRDDQARRTLDDSVETWTRPPITVPRISQVHDQSKDERIGVIREDTLGSVVPKIVEVLLQKLKAKDASVENVAEMYARNGHKLVDDVENLHGTDRRDLAARYDERRCVFIANCKTTQKRVQTLRETMEKISASHDGFPQRELAERRYAAVQMVKDSLGMAKNAGKMMMMMK